MKYVPAQVAAAQWKIARSVNSVVTVNTKRSQRLIFGMSTYIMLVKPIGNTRLSQVSSLRLLASSVAQAIHALLPFVRPPFGTDVCSLSEYIETVKPEVRAQCKEE